MPRVRPATGQLVQLQVWDVVKSAALRRPQRRLPRDARKIADHALTLVQGEPLRRSRREHASGNDRTIAAKEILIGTSRI